MTGVKQIGRTELVECAQSRGRLEEKGEPLTALQRVPAPLGASKLRPKPLSLLDLTPIQTYPQPHRFRHKKMSQVSAKCNEIKDKGI